MTMRTIKYEFKKTKEANSFPSPANFVKPGTCHHIAPLLNDSHVEREKSLFAARSIDNTVPTTKCEFLELTQEAKLFPSRAILSPHPACLLPAWHTPTVFVSTNLNCQLDFSFSSPTFVTICCNLISRSLNTKNLFQLPSRCSEVNIAEPEVNIAEPAFGG